MSAGETRMGPGAEFDAIRELLARIGDGAAGIGDDAAILDLPRGDKLIVSTDAAVENRHFRAGWLTPEEIGYRAVTAALSDLAAMAARPVAVLWAVNLPESWRSRLGALADGARDAARAAGVKIVGGNLAAAAELSIVTTVIGSAFRPLRREGASVGDRIYVTGKLGGPAMALAALAAGTALEARYRARFARPAARLSESRWLADRGATAGLDISDGLAGDARHLAAASAVGLRIDLDRIPRIDGADRIVAARSGEEYELLVTAPGLPTAEFEKAFGLALTEIGDVVAGDSVAFLDGGTPIEIGGGHDHLMASS
jgi:thiamine-monophosphate kinase